MFKNRLQELCQHRKWALPQYTSTRKGPVHDPAFCASVTVNGAQFNSPEPARSCKSAQDMAARVAFEQLSAASSLPPSSPTVLPIDNQVSYKCQLQTYAQKLNKDLPVYNNILEGPSHAPRFKALVTVDGQNYYSEEYCDTLKEAEQAAAKVALMSLPQEGDKQVDSGYYKCFLQELTQKEGFCLPKYNTVWNGMSFSSVVEIENEFFKGDVAKTKKQAEVNAAKFALNHLEERKAKRNESGFTLTCRAKVQLEPAAADLESTVAFEIQKLIPVSASAHAKGDMKDDLGADMYQSVKLPIDDIEVNIEGLLAPVHNSHSHPADQNDINLDAGKSKDENSSHPTIPALDTVDTATKESRSLLCNRVRVYPSKPDMPLPEGATLLPFSDEMWVSVSFVDLN